LPLRSTFLSTLTPFLEVLGDPFFRCRDPPYVVYGARYLKCWDLRRRLIAHGWSLHVLQDSSLAACKTLPSSSCPFQMQRRSIPRTRSSPLCAPSHRRMDVDQTDSDACRAFLLELSFYFANAPRTWSTTNGGPRSLRRCADRRRRAVGDCVPGASIAHRMPGYACSDPVLTKKKTEYSTAMRRCVSRAWRPRKRGTSRNGAGFSRDARLRATGRSVAPQAANQSQRSET
jgi:hypothetical protein